jgi:hypothetical protein
MKKPKNIGIVLLIAFMGMLAMPLLSAPAAPTLDHNKSNVSFFQNGDEHTSQWIIRSISETEEYNNGTTAAASNSLVLFNNCTNYHSAIYKVLFAQIKERKDIKVPKEHIYLSNSCLTI